jgi:hypothetical protein
MPIALRAYLMRKAADVRVVLSGLFFLAMMTNLFAGCTVLRKEIDVPVDHAEINLKEGVTHYRTVLQQLGPPAEMSALPKGLAFLYEHIIANEKQIGISFGSIDILNWFKFSSGKGTADRQALLLIFDEKGILRQQGFQEYHDKMGSGLAVQLFIAIAAMVDSSYLDDAVGPNEWGMSLLMPLPQALNIRQSLDTGTQGLEQGGTPAAVGQHTLELRPDSTLER